MLKIHQLRKHPKSTHRRKVVGRGLGSGHGTYSTRGGKGQTARTGHSKMPVGFEGGRQPLIRQMPKSRGFRSPVEKTLGLSVSRLNIFKDGEKVDLAALKEKGIVHKDTTRVKLLGGNLKKKLQVKLPASQSAQKGIESAGGTVL